MTCGVESNDSYADKCGDYLYNFVKEMLKVVDRYDKPYAIFCSPKYAKEIEKLFGDSYKVVSVAIMEENTVYVMPRETYEQYARGNAE